MDGGGTYEDVIGPLDQIRLVEKTLQRFKRGLDHLEEINLIFMGD